MNAYLADFMISGEWLSGIVVAIIGAIGAVYLKARKDGQNSRSVTVNSPVPRLDVNTREDPEFVTHDQLNGHLTRIEDTFEEIKDALNSERTVARTANGNIHKRIDALSERLGERLSSLEGKTDGVAQNVDKLLDIALNKKPGTRS
jgi:chromatin segregation and condensation protein Rec8/ScpA/Scc1 (kleisin family)